MKSLSNISTTTKAAAFATISCFVIIIFVFVLQQFNYGSKEAPLHSYIEAKRIFNTTNEMKVQLFAKEVLKDKFLTRYEYSDLIDLERTEKNKEALKKFKETL